MGHQDPSRIDQEGISGSPRLDLPDQVSNAAQVYLGDRDAADFLGLTDEGGPCFERDSHGDFGLWLLQLVDAIEHRKIKDVRLEPGTRIPKVDRAVIGLARLGYEEDRLLREVLPNRDHPGREPSHAYLQ